MTQPLLLLEAPLANLAQLQAVHTACPCIAALAAPTLRRRCQYMLECYALYGHQAVWKGHLSQHGCYTDSFLISSSSMICSTLSSFDTCMQCSKVSTVLAALHRCCTSTLTGDYLNR